MTQHILLKSLPNEEAANIAQGSLLTRFPFPV
jgi:hypothetical protein